MVLTDIFSKRLEALKEKKLKLKSDWHSTRSLEDLRSTAQEMIDMLDQLSIQGEIRDMCLKAREYTNTQTTRPPQPAKKKPSLNMDDLDDVYI